MKNYRLHLIRQGITEGNLKGQYCGRRTDTPLCIEGMRELIGLREDYEYPAVGVIFCSPKTSCIQTAGIVYPKQELLTHPGLDEADLGEFDGKTINELQDNEQFVQWLAKSSSAPPPNGENPMDMLGRIAGAMDAIVRYLSREEIFDAALITHGSVISAILGSMSLPRLPAAPVSYTI